MTGALLTGLYVRESLLLGACILIAVALLGVEYAHTDVVIAGLATVQLGTYLLTTFKRVFRHINRDDMSLRKCLLSLGLMVAFYVFAYGIDYCLLTLADSTELKNFSPSNLWYRLVDGWYFSTVTFTATGYGEYVPISYPAKVVVWGEMVLGFATTVFAVSSFVSFSDKD